MNQQHWQVWNLTCKFCANMLPKLFSFVKTKHSASTSLEFSSYLWSDPHLNVKFFIKEIIYEYPVRLTRLSNLTYLMENSAVIKARHWVLREFISFWLLGPVLPGLCPSPRAGPHLNVINAGTFYLLGGDSVYNFNIIPFFWVSIVSTDKYGIVWVSKNSFFYWQNSFGFR